MLPTSHQVPISAQPASPQLLAEAFSDFISASARLELSYRDLQGEVQQLSRELAERNAALTESLAENRQMRQSLEQILDSMPCGVLVLDRERRICLANPEASRLLGISLDVMSSLDDLLADRGLDLSARYDPAGEGSEQELACNGPDGVQWLAVRQRAVSGWTGADTAGSEAQTVLILRDISQRRRIDAERDAARSSIALAEVSAILAHEIRNPLASMELFASLIAEIPEQTGEWVSHLRAGIRSLSGTVNNVLALHGGSVPLLERMDLRRELELAVEFLQPIARQAEIAITLDIGCDASFIRGNRTAVQQLVLNLSTNALRHTPAGGSLRISIAAAGRSVVVHVEDTGCGLAPEVLPRLFRERYSGSGSSSGLGLAVCGRLMRLHGGAISVQSRLGAGSRFTLEFPSL